MNLEAALDLLTLPEAVIALMITGLAGFVKGATGFAMPMIMVSGLGSFLAPELALAFLLVPTLATNIWQALRGGAREAIGAAAQYRAYIVALLVMVLLVAQVVAALPDRVFFVAIGGFVIALVAFLIKGPTFYIPPGKRGFYDVIVGALSGTAGGIAGTWGPLTVAYLTALDTPKREQIRVTGVIFTAGTLMLMAAHLRSGVLNAQTLPWSLAMLVPSIGGMALGNITQDRFDQALFRRVTLFVLLVAGLNLIRRGLF